MQQLATRTGPVSDAVKKAAQQVNAKEISYAKAAGEVAEAVKHWTESGGLREMAAGKAAPAIEGQIPTGERPPGDRAAAPNDDAGPQIVEDEGSQVDT